MRSPISWCVRLGIAAILIFCCATTVLSQSKAIGVRRAISKLPSGIKVPGRYALVIGSSDYDDERIPDLPACYNDANGIYKILVHPAIGMFPKENVTLLVKDKITKPNIIDALDVLGRKVGPSDLVVVFFSGHGAVDSRQRAYWVMRDTNVDKLRATALAETDITELLSEIRTTRLVTLIDACYSAATADVGKTKSLMNLKKIYPKFKGEGRVAITASKGDQLSIVIKDKNHPGYGYSAFAWHLMDGLRGKSDNNTDGVITVSELWDYVKDRTAVTSRAQGGNQQPQLKGQLGSKFMLSVYADRLMKSVEALEAEKKAAEAKIAKLKQMAMAGKISSKAFQQSERILNKSISELDSYDKRQLNEIMSVIGGKLAPGKLERALALLARPETVTKTLTPIADINALEPAAPKEDLRKKYGTRSIEAAKYFKQAVALREAKKLPDCMTILNRAIAGDPDFQLAIYTKASVTYDTGEIDEALKLYDKAIAIDEFNDVGFECYLDKGLILGRIGRMKESNQAFSRAILVDPGNSMGKLWKPYRNMAINHYEHRRYLSALRLAQIGRSYNKERVDAGMVSHFEAKVNEAGQEHAKLLELKLTSAPPPSKREAESKLSPLNQSLFGITNGLQNVLYMPDGSCTVFLEKNKNYYQLIDHRSATPVQRKVDVPGSIITGCISGNELWLLIDKPSDIICFDAIKGKIKQRLGISGVVSSSIAVFPKTRRLFYTHKGTVVALDLSTGRSEQTVYGGHYLQAHPDGQHLFIAYRSPEDPQIQAGNRESIRRHEVEMNEYNNSRNNYGGPGGFRSSRNPVPRSSVPPSFSGYRTDRRQSHLYRVIVDPNSAGSLVLSEFRKNAASYARDLVLSADGKRVAVVGNLMYTPTKKELGNGFGVAVFSAFDLSKQVGFYKTGKDKVNSVSINHVTGQLAIGQRKGGVLLYDLAETAQALETLDVKAASHVCWSGDGKNLTVATAKGVAVYANSLSQKEKLYAKSYRKDAVRTRISLASVKKASIRKPISNNPVKLLQRFTLSINEDMLGRIVNSVIKEQRSAMPPEWKSSGVYSGAKYEKIKALSKESTGKSVTGATIYKLKKATAGADDIYPASYLLGSIYLKQGRRSLGREMLVKAIQGDAGRTTLSLNALKILADDCFASSEGKQGLLCIAWSFYLDAEAPGTKNSLILVLQKSGMNKEVAMLKEIK